MTNPRQTFVDVTGPAGTFRCSLAAFHSTYQAKGYQLVTDDGDALTDLGGGWYQLPNGDRHQGRDNAVAALHSQPESDKE